MLTNVPLVPITVTSMPTALTQMEPSVALANQVSKALERPVLVSKDSVNDVFIYVLNLIVFLKCECIL